MNDIKKIMVALGYSEYAEGIFNYSIKVAKGFDADLLVVNIINTRDVSAVETITSMGYEVDGEQYVKGIREEHEDRLKKMIKAGAYPEEKIKSLIKVGHPVDELLKIIVKESIDMVVMGIKGRTDLEQIFVGSVAEKLFHRSPVPIVSYRNKKIAERLRKRIQIK